jgi:hypothetical protein
MASQCLAVPIGGLKKLHIYYSLLQKPKALNSALKKNTFLQTARFWIQVCRLNKFFIRSKLGTTPQLWEDQRRGHLCSTHMYYCRGRVGIGIRNRRPEIVIISIINEPLLLKKTTVVLSLVQQQGAQ